MLCSWENTKNLPCMKIRECIQGCDFMRKGVESPQRQIYSLYASRLLINFWRPADQDLQLLLNWPATDAPDPRSSPLDSSRSSWPFLDVLLWRNRSSHHHTSVSSPQIPLLIAFWDLELENLPYCNDITCNLSCRHKSYHRPILVDKNFITSIPCQIKLS